MVMAQSLFKLLKQKNPQGNITLMAPDWSRPILYRMPEVDAVVSMPVGHNSLRLGTRYQLARDLRQEQFDQAIVLPGSLKSALIPWFARIPRRTGFVGEQRWGLLNDIRRLDKAKLPRNVERYIALGLDDNQPLPVTLPNPALSPDQAVLPETLSKFNLNLDKPIIGLCPGAEYGPAKRWPEVHYAKVAETMFQRGWQIWLFGSHKDQTVTKEINRLCGNVCQDLSGSTSLGEAVDLMSKTSYVITNDSGLMHVAAALKCEVIALYGSSSDTFTPPLSERSHILNLYLDCSPCFKRECPLGHTNCLQHLLPDQVLEILKKS